MRPKERRKGTKRNELHNDCSRSKDENPAEEVIAITNRSAKTAWLIFDSNDARKHLKRLKESITMKTTSRASRKRKSGRVQSIDSRNSENLKAMNSMSARTNRIANARLKFDSTILSVLVRNRKT